MALKEIVLMGLRQRNGSQVGSGDLAVLNLFHILAIALYIVGWQCVFHTCCSVQEKMKQHPRRIPTEEDVLYIGHSGVPGRHRSHW